MPLIVFMINLARLFSSYRLLEQHIAALKEELERERAEKRKWQDAVLGLKGVQPIHSAPPPPVPQREPPPIGITQLRAREARKEGNGQASEEDILAAVERAGGRR